jgi:hypothetical protein
MLRWRSSIALIAVAFSITACGGDSGGSAPAVVTPSPPVPPPPPPPPPPLATLKATAAGKVIAQYAFYASSELKAIDQLAAGIGTRDGEYFPGFANAFPGAVGVSVTADLTGRYKTVNGIEQTTSTFVRMFAGPDARVVTPLTSILFPTGDQTKLKTALGIRGSLFGMQTVDPDLLTYDVTAELNSTDNARKTDAQRYVAANLRALALAQVVARIEGSKSLPSNLPAYEYRKIADYLSPRAGQFLFTNSVMTSLFQSLAPYKPLSTTTLQAAAHLVDAYAAAIPLTITTAEQTARYTLGIQGFLIPEIDQLLEENSIVAANAALAVTTPEIIAATAMYENYLPFPTTGSYFVAPDFFTMPPSSQIVVPEAGTLKYYLFNTNDLYAYTDFGSGFASYGSIGPIAINIPAANASQIDVTPGPGPAYTIKSLNNFRGVTYFDYTIRHELGSTGTGRVYVRVK